MRAFLALLLLTTAAHADPTCGKHDTVLSALKDQFGEVVIETGMTQDGFLMEMTANPKKPTWTLVLTRPDGMSCLMTAGDQLHAIPAGDPA